jgi:hypothetical protein
MSVLTPEAEVRAARVSDESQVWKAGVWNRHELAAPDCLLGRGELDADGSLVIDRVWANVMKIDGVATDVDKTSRRVTLAAGDKRSYALNVTAGTVGLDRRDRQRDGDPGVLTTGEAAFAIAYRDPVTRELFAHRLESSLADPAAPAAPEPELDTSNAAPGRLTGDAALAITVDRQGNASYFCCNTSGGCGCGSAPIGFCSGCHSASWQIAWPKITGCTASCVGCCLPSDFPRYACHTDLYARNACQTDLGWIQVAIKDCGPNPRCRTTGCKGWDSVRFDLTSCAFSALGGSFSIGHMNLQVSGPV